MCRDEKKHNVVKCYMLITRCWVLGSWMLVILPLIFCFAKGIPGQVAGYFLSLSGD